MDEMLHIATGLATAAEGNARYETGEKHGALIFVKATDQDDAIRKIDRVMLENNWALTIEKMGQVPDATRKPDTTDPIEIAMNTALDEGCGVIIYSEIEE